MAEQALVAGDAGAGGRSLAGAGLAAKLPDEFADLGQPLGRHRLAKTGQPAGRIDRDEAGGGFVAESLGDGVITQADTRDDL